MGKRRLEEIKAKFPMEQGNLNTDSHDIMFEYIRAQKISIKNKKYKTIVLHHVRRELKKLQKRQKSLEAHHDRIFGKTLLFGYWKRWFIEGKIGPEEENEAVFIKPQ